MSVLYTRWFILFSADGKEFCNDFERHPFRFRNFKEDEDQCHGTDNSVNGENTSKAYGVEHDR